MKISGIYKITNLVNNKFYIGSSFNIKKRLWGHKKNLIENRHGNSYLQNAWNKYGEEKFIFEVIEEVTKLEIESILEFKYKLVNIREQYYLDTLLFAQEFIKGENEKFHELGYNINPIATSRLGTTQSKETKLKISMKRKIFIKEIGCSKETRLKLSLANKDKVMSSQSRIKMSNSKKGKKLNKLKFVITNIITNEIFIPTSRYELLKILNLEESERHKIYNCVNTDKVLNNFKITKPLK